jgi:hypothetical protein
MAAGYRALHGAYRQREAVSAATEIQEEIIGRGRGLGQ